MGNEYIFWTQNENGKIKDTIIIDHIVYEGVNTNSTKESLSFLMNFPTKYELYSDIYDKCRVEYKVSNSFKFYTRKKTGTFIQGCFNEKDDEGRFMTFMLWARTDNVDEVMKILSDCCKLMGHKRSVFEADKKYIPEYLSLEIKKKRLYKITMILSIIIVIASFLIYLATN